MNSLFRRIGLVNRRRMIIASIVLIVLTLTAVRQFLGDADWQLSARQDGSTILFEPHFQNHPGHLTLPQAIGMARKINIYNTVLGGMAKNAAPIMRQYSSSPMVGKPAPDFNLRTVDGEQLSLEAGKINVFMFVAMTCPPARIQVPQWNELAAKYDSNQVDFFVIYSRERHPGEPGFRDFQHTTTDSEKYDNALLLSQLTDLTVAVDGIDEAVLSDYGKMMNPAFVIDRDGTMVFQSSWADSNKIEEVVDYLLSHSSGKKDS